MGSSCWTVAGASDWPLVTSAPSDDARFTDAPANGGGYFGVGQVDTGRFYGSFGGDDIGIGLAGGGHCLIVFLLADIFSTQQWNVAFHRQMGDSGRGFGFGLIAFGAVPRRLVGRRIDLIERLACFDITSFNKVTLQDDTRSPGGGLPPTRKAEVRPGSSGGD